MSTRFDLTDEEWALIAPLLPQKRCRQFPHIHQHRALRWRAIVRDLDTGHAIGIGPWGLGEQTGRYPAHPDGRAHGHRSVSSSSRATIRHEPR
jgi:transposase